MVTIQFQPDHERNRNISPRPRRVDTSTAVTGTTSNEAAASYNRDVSRSMHIAMDEAPFTIDVSTLALCTPLENPRSRYISNLKLWLFSR
jgi:hypothetical protein